MAENPRARRLADSIKVIISQTLDRGMKDPRLGFVTLTDVRVTGDLQHASIFYTVYGDEEDRAATAQALKSATGYLRTEVGKGITTRITPSLEFIQDALPETAENLSRLLAEAKARDTQIGQLAAEAQFAGEADPYLKPKEYSFDDDDADDDEAGDSLSEEDLRS